MQSLLLQQQVVEEKCQQAYNLFEKYVILDSTWSQNKDKQSYKTHFKIEGNNTYGRGEIVIEYPYSVVVDFLNEYLDNAEDKDIKELKEIQKFNEDLNISYIRYKGSFGIDDRDFVIATKQFETEGQGIIVSTSVVHPNCPEVKGCVRGEIILEVYKCQKVGENQTQIFYFCSIDPKGSIPDYFKKSEAKEAGEIVFELKEAINKKFGKK